MIDNRKLDWASIILIPAVHLFGLAGVWYVACVKLDLATLMLAIGWYLACGFSITAGYHRLFTHQSYRAAKIVRFFFLIFGAASVQGSVLQWVSNHWRHHNADHNPNEVDPHSIKRGFWYAHCLWLMWQMPPIKGRYINYLNKDPLVRFQQKNYVWLMVVFGFALPMVIAGFWGDALGGLLVAGFLRTTLLWHMTWSVNSIAHTFGDNLFRRTDESRNNWLLAMLALALGELWHNFHHQFPKDCRNGWTWWRVDPTKWLIWLLSKLGLAWNLHQTSPERIQEAILVARQK